MKKNEMPPMKTLIKPQIKLKREAANKINRVIFKSRGTTKEGGKVVLTTCANYEK